jgi:hypothetical protein
MEIMENIKMEKLDLHVLHGEFFPSANFWTTLAPAEVANVISSRLPTP